MRAGQRACPSLAEATRSAAMRPVHVGTELAQWGSVLLVGVGCVHGPVERVHNGHICDLRPGHGEPGRERR